MYMYFVPWNYDVCAHNQSTYSVIAVTSTYTHTHTHKLFFTHTHTLHKTVYKTINSAVLRFKPSWFILSSQKFKFVCLHNQENIWNILMLFSVSFLTLAVLAFSVILSSSLHNWLSVRFWLTRKTRMDWLIAMDNFIISAPLQWLSLVSYLYSLFFRIFWIAITVY